MRQLDWLSGVKSRLVCQGLRSAGMVCQATLLVWLSSSYVWAQDDVTITTPITRSGDDEDLNVRILTISAGASDNASLELLAGASRGAVVNSQAIVVGSLDGEVGGFSILGGSQVATSGDQSVLKTVNADRNYQILQGWGYIGLAAGSTGTVNVIGRDPIGR